MIQQTCGYKNKLLGLVVKDRLYLNFFFRSPVTIPAATQAVYNQK